MIIILINKPIKKILNLYYNDLILEISLFKLKNKNFSYYLIEIKI